MICCDSMKRNVYFTKEGCAPYSGDISDKIVYYNSIFDEYGIPIKTSFEEVANSYVLIRYCPWCGKRFPDSKRDRWFEELEEKGYDDPASQEIPDIYKTSKWYQE